MAVVIHALLQQCLPSVYSCWVTLAMSDLQVRAGEPVSQYEIVKFAQLFNDELTLDNLERIHLVNLWPLCGHPALWHRRLSGEPVSWSQLDINVHRATEVAIHVHS